MSLSFKEKDGATAGQSKRGNAQQSQAQEDQDIPF